MAAATVDSSRKDHPVGVQGLVPFSHAVAVAATSVDDVGDAVLLYLFPQNTFLKANDLDVTSTDMDTGGPTLVMDFGIGDSDGTIDTELIADSDIGQAGGSDAADASTGANYWVDVSEKYFIMSVDTAATTEAAGTITVRGTTAFGLIEASS